MEKRVIIVDFSHQVYAHFFGNRGNQSIRVVVDGQVVEKNTAVQSGCIKSIHRWTKGGSYPTAICFDRPVPSRKAFWQSVFPEMSMGSGKEYKGNRESMPDAMYEAVNDCENILRSAGVPCFGLKNYEADDIIFACVQRAKEKYPGVPIDVITNDADLLPLVDDTVSVFLRSKKSTWAETKELEKAHYVQVTPDNYRSVVEDLSAYRGFLIPYNSLLLHKLLRGDSSDNFQRKEISRYFPKSKYNAMIAQALEDGVNFEEIFRYGKPIYEIYNVVTGEKFEGTKEEALASPEKPNLKQRICNTEELDAIIWFLETYSPLDESQIEVVANVYRGMNLNQPYNNGDKLLNRKEFRIGDGIGTGVDIDTWDEVALQTALRPLMINLNIH